MFVYKKFCVFINKVLGVGIKRTAIVSGFEIEVEVLSKNIYPVIFFLNKHTGCQFKSLIDIVCYDVLGKNAGFFIVYNLLSSTYGVRVRIMSYVAGCGEILSLLGLYRVAG